ncbi:DMT family transporter [Pararhizobium mangrovi]|uniref:DMT family transporter n=2 Tax=Pararhizobium mangrovi TaxID=2590452 RepID=A0A506U6F1_9HYPH|nr:DMT family transporter [Pararhizobium mangrovi]
MAFVVMATCIKAGGIGVPPGQIVFFRSAFAILPILIWLAVHHELGGVLRTRRFGLHLVRGIVGMASMGFNFYGITLLPLPDAIAIGYAKPLIAVILAVVFLSERVRIHRWTAVVAGLTGVMIICWPRLTLFDEGGLGKMEAIGVVFVLASASSAAVTIMLVRRLIATERTPTVVLYLSIIAMIGGLATMPFGWAALDARDVALLVAAGLFGGVGQMLLTQSYRFADVSTVAPFEYASILFAVAIGYGIFGTVPQPTMLVGTGIVVSAGIYLIFRERKLNAARLEARRAIGPSG